MPLIGNSPNKISPNRLGVWIEHTKNREVSQVCWELGILVKTNFGKFLHFQGIWVIFSENLRFVLGNLGNCEALPGFVGNCEALSGFVGN